jgi:hypothetical protein
MMTIYERNMTITYTGEFADDKNMDRKVQDILHSDYAVSLVGPYQWRNKVSDMHYGYQETEDINRLYRVFIDDTLGFECIFVSDADKAVTQLVENGFDAEKRVIESKEKYFKWCGVRGKYLICSFEEQVGVTDTTGLPNLRYNDQLKMTTTFTKEYDSWSLKFSIQYEAETITAKKRAEKQLVEIPLPDMQYIRASVESALRQFLNEGDLEHTIECEGFIKSQSKHECSTETIEMVMNDEN